MAADGSPTAIGCMWYLASSRGGQQHRIYDVYHAVGALDVGDNDGSVIHLHCAACDAMTSSPKTVVAEVSLTTSSAITLPATT